MSSSWESVQHASWLVTVALLWGATNPFLKRGSAGIERIRQPTRLKQTLAEVQFLALNWRYVLPFLLNQCGSVLYYLTIGQAELSLAVPLANSLTFLVTSVVGVLLGEAVHSTRGYLGILLVTSGVTLCVLEKVS